MKKKNEILDITYNATIYNIISKYNDFKKENEVVLTKQLNDYFNYIERKQKINSVNITFVIEILLKNKKLREEIIRNNFSEISTITRVNINKIDFKLLDENILKDEENLFIPFENDFFKNQDDTVSFLKKRLNSSKLIFKDLILMIIDNFKFPKKLNNLSANNWGLNFLNTLNIIFFQINKFMKSKRLDLYNATLAFLNNVDSKTLLFPISISQKSQLINIQAEIKRHIYSLIIKGFHNINSRYYIEIPQCCYNNKHKFLNLRYLEHVDNLIKIVLKKLDVSDIIFIFSISTNYFYDFSDKDLKKLDSIIFKLGKVEEIKILSQKIDKSKMGLIQSNVEFVKKYCLQHNFKIQNFYYNPNFEITATQYFLEFFINYNNYNYKFVIKKFNNKFCWHVFLKDNKTYKINLFLEDDFKHIVQAMLND